MPLFYHFTKDVSEKLILLINEQAGAYDKLLSEADPFFQKWKCKFSEATSMPSDIDLLPNDPLVQGEALEAEAAGEKYFEYFYGLQVIKSSQGVLCGSLTQLARQTLSIAYGQSLPQEKWPQGRPIGSQHLLEIVWCGRNHCLHFEEKPHTRTLACLEKLEQDFGDAFPYSQKPRESLAIELIAILGWTSPIIYAQDIKSLLPPRVTMKTAI